VDISIFIIELRILFYSEKNRRSHANDFRLALFAHVICLILKGSKVIINECDTRRGQRLLRYKSVSLAVKQNKKIDLDGSTSFVCEKTLSGQF